MIAGNIREIIHTLYKQGRTKNQIAHFFELDIKTVRKILADKDYQPKVRKDKKLIDEQELRELHKSCNGYVQRMYEILNEDKGIVIGYSTLTRLVREYITGKTRERCQSFPDIPGEEMQHDTSDYYICVGDKKQKVICSGLYFRYNKMRYIKFYHRFNRFLMKCFFHEALCWFAYSARVCIIDNTHLAVSHGTGENAVFSPEMVAFANKYGFVFKAHRIKLSNRKAGKERNFLTLETNFFPGRKFKNMQDLNEQAKQWATERFAKRPLSKSGLIPYELFQTEKAYLTKLPDYLPAPYRSLERLIDKYGYISFNGNYYWIPEGISGMVKVVEYESKIEIYQKHRKLIEYNLPAWDVKNERFVPEEYKQLARQPSNRKKGSCDEEKKLRHFDDEYLGSYLDYIHSPECTIRQKAKLIRDLYTLSKKLTKTLFIRSIRRALEYGVASIRSIERIAGKLLNEEAEVQHDVIASNTYEDRQAYQQGRIAVEEDLGQYKELSGE
jgi:hypothetical protein